MFGFNFWVFISNFFIHVLKDLTFSVNSFKNYFLFFYQGSTVIGNADFHLAGSLVCAGKQSEMVILEADEQSSK